MMGFLRDDLKYEEIPSKPQEKIPTIYSSKTKLILSRIVFFLELEHDNFFSTEINSSQENKGVVPILSKYLSKVL